MEVKVKNNGLTEVEEHGEVELEVEPAYGAARFDGRGLLDENTSGGGI